MILELASEHFRISKEELIGKSRVRKIIEPRHLTRLILCRYYTLMEVGRLTNCDHPTVLHSKKEALKLIAIDPMLAMSYDELLGKISEQRFSFEQLCIVWGERTTNFKSLMNACEIGSVKFYKVAELYYEMLDRMINIYTWGVRFDLFLGVEKQAKIDAYHRVLSRCELFGSKQQSIKGFVDYELSKLEGK